MKTRKQMKTKKKGYDGQWYDTLTPSSTSTSTSSNNIPMALLGIGVTLAVIYGVVWVAGKAWTKSEA